MEIYQNYQLYRTNVLLGGQMKYDLIVDRCDGDLVVSDFHISPISKSCPFNIHVQDNLLKYSHQENISKYYKQISGSFYKDFINESLYPTSISDGDGDIKTLHDSTYEMGCSRMNYSLYNKQFEFLCPVWLERLNQDEYLDFQFNIYTLPKYDSDSTENITPIISRNLKLNNIDIDSYHNSFVNYMDQYFTYVGIKSNEKSGDQWEGNSNVLNIQPSKNFASISGINIESGLKQTKILPNLIKNMFNREIPLMEFDHLLIQNFEDNKLIANQLFNFNICFNIEDITSQLIYNMMIGSTIRISLVVSICNKKDITYSKILGCRDLYTNYEFIPKKSYNTPLHDYDVSIFDWREIKDTNKYDSIKDINVLNYLKDNTNINYLFKNKLSPSIIHWSLVGNNDYICNAYNGFSGFYTSKDANGGIIYNKTSHLYDNTANILLRNSNLANNSLGWCNMIKINKDKFISLAILNNSEKYFINLCSEFNLRDAAWVNNIKYSKIDPHSKIDHIKLLFIEAPEKIMKSFGENYNLMQKYSITGNFNLYEYPGTADDNNIIILFTDDLDNFTYLNTIDIFNTIKIGKFGVMHDFLLANKNLDDIEIISTPTSLDIFKADSPSQLTTETEYYKNDRKRGEYVMRYFGKIRPTFVSSDNDINFNYRYYKIKLNKNDDISIADYKTYQESGYPPIFPSIQYYYISNEIEEYNNSDALIGEEYKDFNNNKICTLTPVLNFQFITDNEITRNDIIDQLKYAYNLEDDTILNYIYGLYQIKYTLIGKNEYIIGEENISKYNHKVELTLK